MRPNHTRRGIIKALAAGTALGALGACTISRSGNVTTITVNVAKVKAYGTAGINAVSTVLSIAAIASAIGAPAVAIIETASKALEDALAAFSAKAGSSVTVTYDSTSFKTAINSVLSDLQTVAARLSDAVTGASEVLDDKIISTSLTAVNALQTVISVFEGLLGVVSLSEPKMTEEQALKVLRVTV